MKTQNIILITFLVLFHSTFSGIIHKLLNKNNNKGIEPQFTNELIETSDLTDLSAEGDLKFTNALEIGKKSQISLEEPDDHLETIPEELIQENKTNNSNITSTTSNNVKIMNLINNASTMAANLIQIPKTIANSAKFEKTEPNVYSELKETNQPLTTLKNTEQTNANLLESTEKLINQINSDKKLSTNLKVNNNISISNESSNNNNSNELLPPELLENSIDLTEKSSSNVAGKRVGAEFSELYISVLG